ncbi:autotransporter assembly complex protein TamA [Sphingomonas bacterium]|uniref:autotransporter assembly complex protein TamA n=1 Tax=Sphingomonas bacterium TaxID=1895847 RepID=UPI003F68B98C
MFRVIGLRRRHYWLAVALLAAPPAIGQIAQPGRAPAKGPDAPKPTDTPTPQPTSATGQAMPDAPIVPDAEFNAALPPLSGDINAPLEPLVVPPKPPAPDTTPTPAIAVPPPATTATGQLLPLTGDTLAPAGVQDPQLAQPLQPLASFDTAPLETAADIKDKNAPTIRYETVVKGLDATNLTSRFKALSALEGGHGKAANATQVSARAKEDEGLAVRLLKSLGYYDATALAILDKDAAEQGKLRATLTASPGRLYTLSSVTVQADPTTPPELVRQQLPLKVGDAIQADRIQGAEANVSLVLPQRGYPFVKIGDRDILLDDQSDKATGAYTLPVDTGPRAAFGKLTTVGDAVFDLDHLNVFPRFKQGDLYDGRKTDDLRDALVATSLFRTVAVEPQRTGTINPDGTEQVDLLVRQTKGPPRSLAAQAGYSTGEGFKLQGSWTHRNLFPPEGALIGTIIAGSQEQGASGTFRRANAGRRDKTFTAIIAADHSSYDAFNANTVTVSARWSYDSTPIWQKRITYYYGVELDGTNESVYDFGIGDRVRRNYAIAALPAQIEWDHSDSLLNPTKGYRLKLNVSPEGSVQGTARPYARTMAEVDGYFPIGQKLVLAGKARAGSILGIDRDDLAPSRRYYGGGGGSVRGYGFQRLGPLDPQGNPVGGRSLNEFALEARYRFGDFGIVPFFDTGNAYESSMPKFGDLRYGAGIGGRVYTNFGPLRFDVATPLNKRPGDSKIALYISIGQAF